MIQKTKNNRPAIVFIDDESHILKTIKRLTKNLDSDCYFFNSPEDGLEFIKNNYVDIVVSDLNMPGKNGIEVLSEVADINPESIRIIITGYADTENLQLAVNSARIWGLIEKPWDNAQFLSSIESAINFRNQIRKRMNERFSVLEESASEAQIENRLKSEFLALMSHEIRTPMTSVMGALNLLTETTLNEKQRLLVEHASQSGEGLLRLLTDMLTYSKLESGYHKLSVKFCDLNELVNEVLKQFKNNTEKKQLKLTSDLSELQKGDFYTDVNSVRQVLVNLLDNAIKFTQNGEVTVHIKSLKNDEYKVLISDTGIGFDTTENVDVFSKFTQVDLGYDRKHDGTGLGLAICKQLVEKLGGTIGYDTELGKGSTFWFTLKNHQRPLEINTEQQQSESIQFTSPVRDYQSTANDLEQLIGCKVLLAEDSSANQLIIQSMLDGTGLEILIANDGLEAIEILKTTAVDLILMDLSMPNMDGANASTYIREELKQVNLPIIALTANVDTKDIKYCLASGMTDFATKPVDKQYLIDCISYYVNRTSNLTTSSKKESSSKEKDVIVNQDALKQLKSDTSKEMLEKIIKMYINEMQKRSLTIHQCDKNDLITIRNESHAIKSSSYTLGAIKTADLAKSLESACDIPDEKLAYSLTTQLLESIKLTETELGSYIST